MTSSLANGCLQRTSRVMICDIICSSYFVHIPDRGSQRGAKGHRASFARGAEGHPVALKECPLWVISGHGDKSEDVGRGIQNSIRAISL
jgi:hypothetical protein